MFIQTIHWLCCYDTKHLPTYYTSVVAVSSYNCQLKNREILDYLCGQEHAIPCCWMFVLFNCINQVFNDIKETKFNHSTNN